MTKENLLDETSAAIKLGITKELLYAYINNAPKKHLGHDRKLKSIVKNGQNLFDDAELEGFDKYLWEPWSRPNEKRPVLPSYIKDYLKTEIGGNCPITGKGSPLDNAHIEDYSISQSHHHHNLIRIAKDEHTKADSGIIPKAILKTIKEDLITALRSRLSGDRKTSIKSFYPPNPHPIFLGRYNELSELVYAMEYERLIIIEGLGGIGKTELLLNAFSNVKYHNPVVWVDIESAATLADLNIVLQTAVSEVLNKPMENSLTKSLKKEQLTLVFDSLEKILVNDRDGVEDFLKELMTYTDGLQVIITSQIDISIFDSDKKVMKLKGLETEISETLLKRLLPSNIESEASQIHWIMEFCNGHPLTIKLFSSLIKFYESITDAIILVLKQTNIKQPLRKKHTKFTSLEVCFQTIFNCLNQKQKHILMYVKCFVGGLKAKWIIREFDEVTYKQELAVLKQFFLLETFVDTLDFERIIVPNPVKPFLSSKEEEDPNIDFYQIQTDAVESILMEAMIVDSYYVEGGIHGPASYGIHRMEDELPNILEAFNVAQKKVKEFRNSARKKEQDKYLAIVSGISSALGKFCFTRGYFTHGIMFSKAGIKADVALKSYTNAATNYMYLAQIQGRQYDYAGQEQTVRELEDLASEITEPEILANSLWARSRLEIDSGNFESALETYKKALYIVENELAKNSNVQAETEFKSGILNEYFNSLQPGNIALLKSEIAKVYEFSDRYLEAIPHYKEALRLQKKYNDKINTCSTEHHLAICFIETGNINEGVSLLYETVDGFNGNKQYEYLANSISVLGKTAVKVPNLVKHPVFTDAVLKNAVESLFNQMLEFILRVSEQLTLQKAIDNLPFSLLGKYLYITMFMSFTNKQEILLDFILDFADQIDLEKVKPGFLTSLVNLSQGVSIVDTWKNKSIEKDIWIKCIYQSCLILNAGPDVNGKTQVFQWLAIWLDIKALQKSMSAEELFQNAWNSLKKDDKS